MKFLTGSKETLLSYIDKISFLDNLGIITHNDLDGLASAIFLEEILKQKKISVKNLEIVQYKKNMFSDFITKFNRINLNKIFILDIFADNDESFFEFIKYYDTFLIDHHPISDNLKYIINNFEYECKNFKNLNVLKTETHNCSAITLYRLGEEIIDSKKWYDLACSAMITDMSYFEDNNFKFIKQKFQLITKKNIYDDSEIGLIAKKISFSIMYYRDNLNVIYNFLKNQNYDKIEESYNIVNSEIQSCLDEFIGVSKYYSLKNLYFYYKNPQFNIMSTIATTMSVKIPDSTIVCAYDLDENHIKISARNQSKSVDMNLLLKQGIYSLENATAGGHMPAAAAVILKKDLDQFIDNILKNK